MADYGEANSIIIFTLSFTQYPTYFSILHLFNENENEKKIITLPLLNRVVS